MKEQEGIQKISIDSLLKRVMVQMKYEEIGSWLITHNVPLFYAHKNGFTIIDKKYIEEHPKLKKMLDDTVKDIQKRNQKLLNPLQKTKKETNYFG